MREDSLMKQIINIRPRGKEIPPATVENGTTCKPNPLGAENKIIILFSLQQTKIAKQFLIKH